MNQHSSAKLPQQFQATGFISIPAATKILRLRPLPRPPVTQALGEADDATRTERGDGIGKRRERAEHSESRNRAELPEFKRYPTREQTACAGFQICSVGRSCGNFLARE